MSEVPLFILHLMPRRPPFARSRGRRSQTVSADCLTVCHPRDLMPRRRQGEEGAGGTVDDTLGRECSERDQRGSSSLERDLRDTGCETCEIQGRAEPQTAALFSFWAIPQTSVKALSEMLPQRVPYTLDPASYILHPTTYILHPTRYTPHPAPYTIHIRLAF